MESNGHDVGLFRGGGAGVRGRPRRRRVVDGFERRGGAEGTWVRTRRTSSRSWGSHGTSGHPAWSTSTPVRRSTSARCSRIDGVALSNLGGLSSAGGAFFQPDGQHSASAFHRRQHRLTGLQRRLQRGRLALAGSQRRVHRANLAQRRRLRAVADGHPEARGGSGVHAALMPGGELFPSPTPRGRPSAGRSEGAAWPAAAGGGSLPTPSSPPSTRLGGASAMSVVAAGGARRSEGAWDGSGRTPGCCEGKPARCSMVPNFSALALVLMRSSPTSRASAFSGRCPGLAPEGSAVWSSAASARSNVYVVDGRDSRGGPRMASSRRRNSRARESTACLEGPRGDVADAHPPFGGRGTARRGALVASTTEARGGGRLAIADECSGRAVLRCDARRRSRRPSRSRGLGPGATDGGAVRAGEGNELKLSRFKRTASMVRRGGLSC